MTVKLVDALRLLDNARTHLPGALDSAITQEVFNVLTDFFNRTNIWWEDVNVPLAANLQYTTVDIVPDEGRINRLLGVYANGDITQLRRMAMPTPGCLQFIDVPGSDTTWTARCALCPADPVPQSGQLAGFPQAPDFVLTRYHEGLMHGVVAAMMMQVSKPYTNPKMALLHQGKYRATVSEAKTETRHSNVFAGQRWSFPSFATRNA
jgi:hypothetical protein